MNQSQNTKLYRPSGYVEIKLDDTRGKKAMKYEPEDLFAESLDQNGLEKGNPRSSRTYSIYMHLWKKGFKTSILYNSSQYNPKFLVI